VLLLVLLLPSFCLCPRRRCRFNDCHLRSALNFSSETDACGSVVDFTIVPFCFCFLFLRFFCAGLWFFSLRLERQPRHLGIVDTVFDEQLLQAQRSEVGAT